jgi:hypothetical protein
VSITDNINVKLSIAKNQPSSDIHIDHDFMVSKEGSLDNGRYDIYIERERIRLLYFA